MTAATFNLSSVDTLDLFVTREFDGETLVLDFDRHGVDIAVKGAGHIKITPQMLAWLNAQNERYGRLVAQLNAAVEQKDAAE